MLYRVGGIVIRSMDYGEGNKIITLCTEAHGKVAVFVRGAKKARSRHGALVQPFTYGEFSFIRSGTGMGTLNQGEVIESNHRLREDIILAAYSAYACELVDKALQDNETGHFWFEQLKAYLSFLGEGRDPVVLTSLFEMKVLQAAGYGPQVDACMFSGETEGKFWISAGLGGILSEKERRQDPAAVLVSPGVLKLLRLFSRLDIRRLGNIDVKEETRTELKKVMNSFMEAQLGLKLKSRRFLEQLERYEI
ncbi:DNA repair protein RecO [Paenibacillus wulumuqiensis]|uniref:DNA repair protein RecO n=1 Tax=Paenibacillus wulumuqiensis TaxID=1567107 RepID=UPI0006198FE8|nr:DNA repair protein RecO [Paenibacillus wulumuqiensis]